MTATTSPAPTACALALNFHRSESPKPDEQAPTTYGPHYKNEGDAAAPESWTARLGSHR